ncbi:nuclear pore complex protein Nup107 [Neocloeon triangulifer]|uniref:nuclear pore complex protein Nup107 n=1 Tax=Neocloeon triangulifer TaxID=2078957 RepID=UPI00286F517B|nr:nuclear pore complex protein Nup107 [Neocloeon triangulifer]
MLRRLPVSGPRSLDLDDSMADADDTMQMLRSPMQRLPLRSSTLDTTASVFDSTNMDVTILPGEISKFYSQSLLSESAEPLEALAQAFFDVLDAHSDAQEAFDAIKEFHHVCDSFAQNFRNCNLLEKWLTDERNTWRLVETLYADRLNFDEDSKDVGMELRISEKEVMLDVFRQDNITRQCQLVVDWLEQTEASRKENAQLLRAEHFSDKTVTWENTIFQLKQRDNLAYNSNVALVTEIDPDAPVRQSRYIHKLDAEDEAILLGQILSHVRCGQLDLAQRLCVHCGQPWRAATLEGWRLYHDPNLSKDQDTGVLEAVEGNPNRDLWKLAAWHMSKDPRLPQTARTTYAALCGHLQAMLPSMATWADWLWAHLRAMIDVRIEEEIRERVDKQFVEMPNNYWANKMSQAQIFAALASSIDPKVRAEHADDFPTLQRFIILDDVATLYSTLAAWTRQHANLPSQKSPLLLRFAAHLVLVLKQLGKEENEICAHYASEVLKTYTKYVMGLKRPEIVIAYVAKLPKKEQVDVLAAYLEGITDPDIKTQCAILANNADLDFTKAARKVVVAIRERQTSKPGLNPVEEDVAKIDALEWLSICPSQSVEALWHSNALVRQFVSKGKLDLARNAYAKIPPDVLHTIVQQGQLLSENEDCSPRHSAAMREYLSFQLYLDAHKDFGEWLHYLHKRPVAPEAVSKEAAFQQKLLYEEQIKFYKSSLESWKKNLNHMAEVCKKRFMNILTFPDGVWLKERDELELSPEVVARNNEIDSLIRIVVPQAAFLVHEISLKSGDAKFSLHLANIIASERYELYRHFSKKDLRELLQKISESSVELLKMKLDPFGHEVTT